VILINDGEIVEQATHQQLLDAKGFFHGLYMSQFNGLAIQAITPGGCPVCRLPPGRRLTAPFFYVFLTPSPLFLVPILTCDCLHC
jgi:hypothetical protein